MLRVFLALIAFSFPASAMAQGWSVDDAASTVGFETRAFGTDVTGSFPDWSAEITLDPADLSSASLSARVETASTTSGNSQIDESMLSGDGLAPQTHPLARFVSDDIRASEMGYEAHGMMTIRGVEQALILPFTLTIEDGHAIANGQFEITRSDYGVGTANWGDSAAEVMIVLHIEADAS